MYTFKIKGKFITTYRNGSKVGRSLNNKTNIKRLEKEGYIQSA